MIRAARSRGLASIAALLLAWAAAAAAQLVLLGSVTVQSRHGEPLRALVSTLEGSADAGALEGVELANRRTYEQLGLTWNPALESARVVVGRRADGRAEVLVTTTEPVTADDLTLLLDVRSRGGRYQRSFLLRVRDPGGEPAVALPSTAPRAPTPAAGGAPPLPGPSWSDAAPPSVAVPSPIAVPGPVAVPTPAGATESALAAPPAPPAVAWIPPAPAAPAAMAPPPAPDTAAALPAAEPVAPVAAAAGIASPAASPAAPTATGSGATRAASPPPRPGPSARGATADRLPDGFIDRVTVAPGATLADVARTVRAPGATLEQTIVALYDTNRGAFEGDNLHRLRAGATLLVPDPLIVDAFESGEARSTIRSQWLALRPQRATAPTDGSATPRAARAAGAAADDQLVLAPPAAAGGRADPRPAEAQAAFDAAMREAASRIRDLEQNVAGLNTLISLTEQRTTALRDELQRIQARSGAGGALRPAVATTAPGGARTPVAAAPAPVAEPTTPPAAPVMSAPPVSQSPVAGDGTDTRRSVTDIATLRAAAPVSQIAPPPRTAPSAETWPESFWLAAAVASVLLLLLVAAMLRRRRRRDAAKQVEEEEDELIPDFGVAR